jgi:hypothetical protein
MLLCSKLIRCLRATSEYATKWILRVTSECV